VGVTDGLVVLEALRDDLGLPATLGVAVMLAEGVTVPKTDTESDT